MQIKKTNTTIKQLSPYLFWALISIVTALLLMESSGSTPSFPHSDKIAHTMLFAMLTAIGTLVYSKYRIWLYSCLIAYGVITELMQATLTTTRHASFYDWLADLTGILLCVFMIKFLKYQATKKTPYVS